MIKEKINITQLIFRNLLHKSALNWSVGHETFLDRIWKKNPKIINIAVIINRVSLYSDIKVIYGNIPTKLANVVPIPKVIIRAGSAQHTNVPNEVNKVSEGIKVWNQIDSLFFFTSNLSYRIASISNKLLDNTII